MALYPRLTYNILLEVVKVSQGLCRRVLWTGEVLVEGILVIRVLRIL